MIIKLGSWYLRLEGSVQDFINIQFYLSISMHLHTSMQLPLGNLLRSRGQLQLEWLLHTFTIFT